MTTTAADPEESATLEPRATLSPSRAGDFLACPLLYRFRTVDRLPQRPSPDATRGTLVHKVLEDLFDLPAAERTLEAAADLIEPSWSTLLELEPELATMFPEPEALGAWLETGRLALTRYFALEDPRLLEPHDRELYVEAPAADDLILRGVIDRVDVAPDGAVRIVDYKTGRAPRVGHETRALFQLKFYGLLLWRTRGVLPRRLQLIYLGDGEIITYDPDEQDLLATERKARAIWEAISIAHETGDWQPSKGPICRWCDHQALCPAYGGTPPPLPTKDPAARDRAAPAE